MKQEKIISYKGFDENDATRWYINPPYKNGSCKVYLPITNDYDNIRTRNNERSKELLQNKDQY